MDSGLSDSGDKGDSGLLLSKYSSKYPLCVVSVEKLCSALCDEESVRPERSFA